MGCAPAPAPANPAPQAVSTSVGSALGPQRPTAAGASPSLASPPVSAAPAPVVEAPAADSQPSARPRPPKAGDPAYDFALESLDGGQVSLSDFRGKNVMLNFWATWCGPCRIEIPHMVKLYGEMSGQDFEILAVNLREDSGRVRAFVSEYDMRFPILLDPQGKVGGAYFVRGIPTSVFVDREGIITAVHTGSLTDTALRRYVNDLMQ